MITTNLEISIDTLNKFLHQKFSGLFPDFIYEGYGDYESNQMDILYEVENYGLKTISDLEKIIPLNYIEKVKEFKLKSNYLGTIRIILIVNDSERYVRNYNDFNYRNFWEIENLKSIEHFLNSYNISIDKIIAETKDK